MRAVSFAIASMIAGMAGCSSPAHEPRVHHVAIRGMQFEPATLQISIGDSVLWTNEDVVPHTVTDIGEFDSESIATKQEWRYTAKKAGDFAYGCTFHPTMKGTLTVR